MNLDDLIKKCAFFHQLKNTDVIFSELFNIDKKELNVLEETWRPNKEFKPVVLLRYLILQKVFKNENITRETIEALKNDIEARDISEHYDASDEYKSSLVSYKESKIGMFPQWTQPFSILYPFFNSKEFDSLIKESLKSLGQEIIFRFKLEDTYSHAVGFGGSQNYGTDEIWVAVIPNQSKDVQHAYQLFFRITSKGVNGGLAIGHKLIDDEFKEINASFTSWSEFENSLSSIVPQWKVLNSKIDFTLQTDELDFIKRLKQSSRTELDIYFNLLDYIVKELNLSDEKNLVFSTGSSQLSFQVGKRYCLNLKKELFSFIAPERLNIKDLKKTSFSGASSPCYYAGVDSKIVKENIASIMEAIQFEIESDNHTKDKEYDNAAFRKAVFDKTYRAQLFSRNLTFDFKGEIWKLGCNWEKSYNSFYEWLKKDEFVIGVDGFRYSVGDLIAVTEGYNVKAIAEVIENPISSIEKPELEDKFSEYKIEYNSRVNVASVKFYELSKDEEFDYKLIQGIRRIQQKHIRKKVLNLWSKYSGIGNFRTTSDENKESSTNDLCHPLNTIFYGPPGTGKTYNSVLRAAEIIARRSINNYEEALEIFNEHLHDKIEFITFHQNYSYEDFIQGLRPNTENKGQLSFEKKDGVFTQIAINALFEYYKVAQVQKSINNNTNQTLDVSEIYLDFVESLKSNDEKDYTSKNGSIVRISAFTRNDNIEFKPQNSIRSYLVSGKRLLKLFGFFSDIEMIKNVDSGIRDAIGGCNTTIYWIALKEFISFYNNYIESSVDEEVQTYEEVSYETKRKLLSNISLDELNDIGDVEVPNYVIIIDEINRANISRVFGELITLIEPDKRSHGNIPMEAKLPSGDSFIVPSNLYIVGTMNTADKSIALLDIALRRRFDFESMYPKYTIPGYEIYDPGILKKINDQIIGSKGHDFQIGHSYFMGDNNDLVKRMNKKVIPLLLEYYMNDEKDVIKILTNAGLKVVEGSWPIEIKV